MTGPDFKHVNLCWHCGQRIFGDVAAHIKDEHGLDYDEFKYTSVFEGLIHMSFSQEEVDEKLLRSAIEGGMEREMARMALSKFKMMSGIEKNQAIAKELMKMGLDRKSCPK